MYLCAFLTCSIQVVVILLHFSITPCQRNVFNLIGIPLVNHILYFSAKVNSDGSVLTEMDILLTPEQWATRHRFQLIFHCSGLVIILYMNVH